MVIFRESVRFTVQRGDGSRPEHESDEASTRRSRLLCALCRAVIAGEPQRIEMRGAHAHTLSNPAGFLFHIGCFAEAPGTARLGAANSAFSWFPGFVWRIAVCGGCGEHLGWHFRAEATNAQFFGLILDKLVEE